MNNIIISNKNWHKKYIDEIEKRTGSTIVYIDDINMVTYENIKQYSPRYVFFPHWSYIIPKEVYKKFECVIFHMTDLPFGRGGSPLQNLIVRGIYESKLSAIRCEKELDSGDVYIKRPLSLYGDAEEIYLRAAEMTKEMMIELIKNPIKPREQVGEIVTFKRRKPKDSNLKDLKNINSVFDYIRMLDADSYPKAFLNTENLRLEFERASLKDGYIKADVKIMLREDEDE